MNSLTTIQKTFHVFQILTKIAMILCFVGAGLCLLSLLCGVVWYCGGTVVGADQATLYRLTASNGLRDLIAACLTSSILTLTDGVLFAFAMRYFMAEQADGTPFTQQGAVRIRRLGIRTIVLPMVAAVLCAIVCSLCDLPRNTGGDWNGFFSIALGIGLILTSLIFRYGADLEERVK
ncbi:MAG: hypothetical protein KIG74_00295 [Clostridiaceae bacterium]|nr:hypothetical protein [Clostridiaceae bacterium]